MQIEMKLRGTPEPNHYWNPHDRRWHLTQQGWQRLKSGKPPRVRWSNDSHIWYDRATGEMHNPYRNYGNRRGNLTGPTK